MEDRNRAILFSEADSGLTPKRQPPRGISTSAALASARTYAEAVRTLLAETCSHFELAGALRRGCLELTEKGLLNLEFVAVPQFALVPGWESGLAAYEKDLLVDAVEGLEESGEAILCPSWPHRESQLHKLTFMWGNVMIWLARPDNFGSLLLWRTGPRSHCDWLCNRARRRQSCWVPYAGLFDGTRTIGATEPEIYARPWLSLHSPGQTGKWLQARQIRPPRDSRSGVEHRFKPGLTGR